MVGGMFGMITYDPDFNHIYLGTGNGSPWNQKEEVQAGVIIYSCALF